MKAAAISKTRNGGEVVVAVFEAKDEAGIQNIANRWLDCSGRLAPLSDDDTTETAQAKLERYEL